MTWSFDFERSFQSHLPMTSLTPISNVLGVDNTEFSQANADFLSTAGRLLIVVGAGLGGPAIGVITALIGIGAIVSSNGLYQEIASITTTTTTVASTIPDVTRNDCGIASYEGDRIKLDLTYSNNLDCYVTLKFPSNTPFTLSIANFEVSLTFINF